VKFAQRTYGSDFLHFPRLTVVS